MRISFLHAVCAASALTLLAGCSGVGPSAVAPSSGNGLMHVGLHQNTQGRSTSVLPGKFQRPATRGVKQFVNHNSCSATGMLVYVSDAANGVVNIYDNGTTLCGQITGFSEPQGMTVHKHVLYVANTGFENIEAFNRGSTSPDMTLTDPSGQFPVDVAVAPDGTIIGSNIFSPNTGLGSVSTWTKTGTFVENFVPGGLLESFFITTFHNGTVFEDGFDANGFSGLWSFSCPGGVCSGDVELGEPFAFPGGLVQTKSCDLLGLDQISDTADTFELPSMTPATFTENGGDNVDVDTTKTRPYQVWTGDALNNELVCYQYKQDGSSPGSCGTVPGNTFGDDLGVAIDPGF